MTKTGTIEAFKALLDKRGIYATLEVDRSRVSNWKKYFSGKPGGEKPSIERMEELLAKAGAEVVQEKIWKLPL